MSGAAWISNRLYLGKTAIGAVSRSKVPGEWLAMSFLPGAATMIGRDLPNEAAAKELVMKSAQSRCKAMFGAGIDTTTRAVEEGRTLRQIARAIWRAGVWQCDRPVNAHAMFADLGMALGFKSEDAPSPNPNREQGSGSTADEVPDEFDPLEDLERDIA